MINPASQLRSVEIPVGLSFAHDIHLKWWIPRGARIFVSVHDALDATTSHLVGRSTIFVFGIHLESDCELEMNSI